MKTKIHLILAVVCLLTTFGITAQTTITVDNNPGSTTTHQTLQSAVTDAVDGDIIYLQPSETVYGSAIINKPLTIVGRSHSQPNKRSRCDVLNIIASNVTVKGFNTNFLRINPTVDIENINIFEVSCNSIMTVGSSTTGLVSDVVIQGSVLRGIDVASTTENVLIANNIFSTSNPLTINQAATTIVTNNVFKTISTTNPVVLVNNDTASLILTNNMFFGGGAGNTDRTFEFDTGNFTLNNNLTFRPGSPNIILSTTNGGSLTQNNTLANINPLFTNIQSGTVNSFGGGSSYNPAADLSDDFTLQAGSPALTGGTNGSQIGVYGGNFLYKTLGQPRGIPTLDVISNDVTVQQGGTLNITINAKAN